MIAIPFPAMTPYAGMSIPTTKDGQAPNWRQGGYATVDLREVRKVMASGAWRTYYYVCKPYRARLHGPVALTHGVTFTYVRPKTER